jgi:ABC-type glycerol-3-phosphate transport system permease component
MKNKAFFIPTIYVGFLLAPIYWLIIMSVKTTKEIESSFIPYPQAPTLENFEFIFSDPAWYLGYLNALIYVLMNVAISVTVAVPAAYAFSRYRFVGQRVLFFGFLTFRMMAPAILLVPYSISLTHISRSPSPIASSTCPSRSGYSRDSFPAFHEKWTRAPVSMAMAYCAISERSSFLRSRPASP